MAEGFDVRLGLTEGTNRVIADEANPSGFAALAEFATSAISGYSSIRDDLAKDKAKRKAEQAKVAQQSLALEVARSPDLISSAAGSANAARASQLAEVQQFNDLNMRYSGAVVDQRGAEGENPLDRMSPFYQPPAEISPEMEREVNESGQKVANIVTAVQQGRMPEISIQSVATARFRQLREKYPDQAEYLIDTWKKLGLDKATSPEIADAVDEHEFAREQRQQSADDARKRREAAIAAGRTVLGEFAIGRPDDELEIIGLRDQRQSQELDRVSRELNITIQRNGIASAEATAAKESANQNFEVQYEVAAHNQAAPIVRNLVQLSDAILKDPGNTELIQQFQAMGVKVRQAIPTIASGMVTQAVSLGFTGDKEALQKRIEGKYGAIVDLFVGDSSVVEVNTKALKAIQNSIKIETHLALPFMQGLIAAGMKPMDMPGFLKAVDGNPKLQQDLSNEVQGFLTDWGKDRASTRILNAVKILRGETTLERVEPGRVGEAVRMVGEATVGIARDYVRGTGGSGDMVVNGVGEMVVAARAVHPGSGSAAIAGVTNTYASENVRRAVIKALNDPNVSDKDMTRATIQAGRAASAHMLGNLYLAIPQANKSSPFHKAVWDAKSGRYTIQRTPEFAQQARKGGMNDGFIAKYGQNAVTPAARARSANLQAPKELTRLVHAANMNLDAAIEYGKHDPSTPKATDLQLRNYYAREKPLPVEKGDTPVNLVKETQKMIDNMDDILDSQIVDATKPLKAPDIPMGPGSRTVQGVKGQTVTVPSVSEIASKYSGNGNYQAIVTTAQELGIPTEIATRLGYVESRFNDNMTPNGSGAMGPVQVVPKYHNPLAQRLFGKNVPELTPAQIVKVGLTYLKNEYDKHGNWPDAISAYHSGGPLSKKGNANDGNLYTRDYARLIGG